MKERSDPKPAKLPSSTEAPEGRDLPPMEPVDEETRRFIGYLVDDALRELGLLR